MRIYRVTLLLICMIAALWSCDQLGEDVLPKSTLDEHSVINNSEIFAIKGEPMVINVLGDPLENASISLNHQSDKSEVSWLKNQLVKYTANESASGKDYIIFEVSTPSQSFTDSIIVNIGDSSQFETDSCMPYAKNDVLYIEGSLSAEVGVLANDILCQYTLDKLNIIGAPNFGTATITANNAISYTLEDTANFISDSIVYEAKLIGPADEATAIYGFLEVFMTSDQDTCYIEAYSGFDAIPLDSVLYIDVTATDSICNNAVSQINYGQISLGVIEAINNNVAKFTPSIEGIDSLWYEVTLANGRSYTGSHVIEVMAPANDSSCNVLSLSDDFFTLNIDSTAVLDMDILSNDVYCGLPGQFSISIPDSMNLSFGQAQIKNEAGYLYVRYLADSAAWQNDVAEQFSYLVCEGNECDTAQITIQKP
ncbi:hypothetical protein GCM10027429_22530 [Marivirga atlantica]|uniref:Uncharacterized protein n=1 Tax=Marivirga atlantica TaxID=1548457 RepID=A0A937AFN5_9BACT|nr:hypothetical protein [Marivirga atlantica]MBL0765871.1 hypothetical protein [Marivirga atlantica]